MLPIGGNFTMDPVDAAYATMLKPKYGIPMHYGANPLGKGTRAWQHAGHSFYNQGRPTTHRA
jgi:L-ascorbate metabolism protein UlaG (beta-lactamase superfamily)